jgi:hypothetical protein
LSDAASFPKQECIRRFRGIVVDSAVFEHAGGRGRPRSRRALFSEQLLTRHLEAGSGKKGNL